MTSAQSGAVVRRLALSDMEPAARVHRDAFDHRLPWLSGLHTRDEDVDFFRKQVFRTCEMWGAFDGRNLTGFIAYRDEWIDQLYVLPGAQGGGIGTRLLSIAKAASPSLSLWTFQRNANARSFYESRGFSVVELTDGSRNDEKEPDVLYRWVRAIHP